MKIITPTDAFYLLRRFSYGKFFRVTFRKADGSIRRLIGRTGVHQFTNGDGMRYNPDDRMNVIVWDAAIQEYRTVPCYRIMEIKMRHQLYKID
jgi:hypothetical protein